MKALLALTLVPTFCLAQSIGQIGISAAGGSAAGAAGKKVSDAFDNVMGKGAGILAGAAKTGERKPQENKSQRLAPLVPPEPSFAETSAPAPAVTPLALPTLAPRPSSTPVFRPRRQSESRVDLPATFASLVMPAPRPPSASQQLRSLEVGSSRDALIGQVGKPAGRITMYDDRGLVEVYSYREGRNHAGTVRLVNGTVTEVKLP